LRLEAVRGHSRTAQEKETARASGRTPRGTARSAAGQRFFGTGLQRARVSVAILRDLFILILKTRTLEI
jgi:hypothetical protein